MSDAPLSVKRLLDQIKARMEPSFASLCVIGEVSNFRGSGKHWYFTLKDEGAQIQCAVWAGQQRFMVHAPKDGQRVVVKGSLNVYVQGGSFTLAVTHCEAAGAGDLQAQLRQIEAELRAEGLFDFPKRKLPRFPVCIGVVAAKGGAALQDVLEVTRHRSPGINLCVATAAAQGDRCVPEVVEALAALQDPRWKCDVILLVRGGGSLEDLWAFNDPAMVRAVANSPVPIITGVGHEIDMTLVDLAADRRAATPSQAAELATPDLAQLRRELGGHVTALYDRMQWRLRGMESTVNLLMDSRGMREVPLRVERMATRLDTLRHRLFRVDPLSGAQPRYEQISKRLHLAHPERRLDAAAHHLSLLRHRLASLGPVVAREADLPRIQELRRKADAALANLIIQRERERDVLAARLEGLDPKAPLHRGFVLARSVDGRPVTSSQSLPTNASLSLLWFDGERTAQLRD